MEMRIRQSNEPATTDFHGLTASEITIFSMLILNFIEINIVMRQAYPLVKH